MSLSRSRVPFGAVLLAQFAFAVVTPAASAGDTRPYEATLDLETKSGDIVIRHHHNWSTVSADTLRHTMSAPFGAGNTYSTLAAYAADGKLLWQVPSPPLTWLGVTGDGQHIIGLSVIKYLNPTQAVVFGLNGRLLARRTVSTRCFTGDARQAEIDKQPEKLRRVFAEFRVPECVEKGPAIGETYLNYVDFYQQRDPGARLVRGDGHIIGIDLEDPKGRDFRLPLTEWQAADAG